MPLPLLFLAGLCAAALAGAWLFDLAHSRWGERHPRLRDLAMLFAFTAGAAMLAAMVTLPPRLVWAAILSAPRPRASPLSG